jgi:hypothetical protein
MEARQESTAISVMLIVPDADAAVVWYKDVWGAKIRCASWDSRFAGRMLIFGTPHAL